MVVSTSFVAHQMELTRWVVKEDWGLSLNQQNGYLTCKQTFIYIQQVFFSRKLLEGFRLKMGDWDRSCALVQKLIPKIG